LGKNFAAHNPGQDSYRTHSHAHSRLPPGSLFSRGHDHTSCWNEGWDHKRWGANNNRHARRSTNRSPRPLTKTIARKGDSLRRIFRDASAASSQLHCAGTRSAHHSAISSSPRRQHMPWRPPRHQTKRPDGRGALPCRRKKGPEARAAVTQAYRLERREFDIARGTGTTRKETTAPKGSSALSQRP